MYWTLEIVLWANLLAYITLMFVVIFRCVPREAIWNPTVPARCLDPLLPLWISSAINLSSDLLVFGLTVVAVSRLQQTLGKKIGFIIIFTSGFMYVAYSNGPRLWLIHRRSFVAGIMRLVYNTAQASDDLSYETVPLTGWA